ncbi:hypothetical protein [Massilia haematophila]|uniref:Uncharacterized protein n=1 Tax=Massilia haematophila TaxID=457923 RepID=A0ABV7PVF0_9BURK
MSFNDTDISNWARVVEIFGAIEIEIDDDSERVVFVPIRANIFDRNIAVILAEGMRSITRIDENVNIWIDVQDEEVPVYVKEAIGLCGGSALRIVLTHDNASSHAPGERLSAELIDSISKSAAPGFVWHPFAKKLVPSLWLNFE